MRRFIPSQVQLKIPNTWGQYEQNHYAQLYTQALRQIRDVSSVLYRFLIEYNHLIIFEVVDHMAKPGTVGVANYINGMVYITLARSEIGTQTSMANAQLITNIHDWRQVNKRPVKDLANIASLGDSVADRERASLIHELGHAFLHLAGPSGNMPLNVSKAMYALPITSVYSEKKLHIGKLQTQGVSERFCELLTLCAIAPRKALPIHRGSLKRAIKAVLNSKPLSPGQSAPRFWHLPQRS